VAVRILIVQRVSSLSDSYLKFDERISLYPHRPPEDSGMHLLIGICIVCKSDGTELSIVDLAASGGLYSQCEQNPTHMHELHLMFQVMEQRQFMSYLWGIKSSLKAIFTISRVFCS
jgi:hypothetical protein